jgi:hypothetical protein
MTKQNLFSLLSFFSAVGWLQILGVQPGFAYAAWIVIIVTELGLLYGICLDDQKKEE